MRRRAPILTGAAALIAVAGAWYYASPWWTLWHAREVALAGDAAQFASYVDFGAVRKDAQAEARADWPWTLAILQSAMWPHGDSVAVAPHALSARELDALVGPESVREAVTDINLRKVDAIGGRENYRPVIVRRGFDEFLVRSASTPSPGCFLFRRHGLGWKLEAVRWFRGRSGEDPCAASAPAHR
jgi:hypothetical protein